MDKKQELRTQKDGGSLSALHQDQEFEFVILRKNDTGNLWYAGLEIIFVLMGSGTLYELDGTSVYSVKEGDIFVINSFCMRQLDLEDGASAIALRISSSFITAISPETANLYINCKSFLHAQDRQENFDILRRDFARAFSAYYKNESGRSVYLRTKISVLLDDLIRCFMEDAPQLRNESGRERLRLAIEYIQANFRENITLDDLAERTFLSKTYISHSFQKYLGISFTGYLTMVRLAHAQTLLGGKNTVTDIAYESGFSSANAMIKAFKHYRGSTPGAYRRRIESEKEMNREASCMAEIDFSNVFASLLKYMDEAKTTRRTSQEKAYEISMDLKEPDIPYHNSWRKIINAGYAKDLMNGTLQKQIRKVQKKIGFRYIRIKGILDDDMGVYVRDILGQINPNYTYVDEVIDFILSVEARPAIELGHMPGALAANHCKLSMRNFFISPASDLKAWQDLVQGLMEHLCQRYGAEEMGKWMIEPWISPGYGDMGAFSFEVYTDHYLASYKAIRSVCPSIKIMGPGGEPASSEMSDFFDMCIAHDCMPDIISLKLFSAVNPGEENSGLKLIGNNESFYMAVSGDEKYLKKMYKKACQISEREGFPGLPVMISEWSNNIWQRDLCNDTCYKSAYIFKSVIENGSLYDGMGYFAISDQMDEVPPVAGLFHGGFGLFAKYNLPKSGFRAMELLSAMGDRLVLQTEGCLITATDDQIQIFLYNYCHYDLLYRYRHTINISLTDRYRVFNESYFRSYNISVKNLCPGIHTVRQYRISPEGGSVYDAWVKMGAPEKPTEYEQKQLKALSGPEYYTQNMETDGTLLLQAGLVAHEVRLITVEKNSI